jgi:hypothetical protein
MLDLRNLSAEEASCRYREHLYGHVECSACGQLWQRIDYGSALHRLFCGYPLPPPVGGWSTVASRATSQGEGRE